MRVAGYGYLDWGYGIANLGLFRNMELGDYHAIEV